jgi:hypothetical protein
VPNTAAKAALTAGSGLLCAPAEVPLDADESEALEDEVVSEDDDADDEDDDDDDDEEDEDEDEDEEDDAEDVDDADEPLDDAAASEDTVTEDEGAALDDVPPPFEPPPEPPPQAARRLLADTDSVPIPKSARRLESRGPSSGCVTRSNCGRSSGDSGFWLIVGGLLIS